MDNVDNIMHLLVLSIPCFINSRLFDILEKNKHKFVIKASKIMAVRDLGSIPDPTEDLLQKYYLSHYLQSS